MAILKWSSYFKSNNYPFDLSGHWWDIGSKPGGKTPTDSVTSHLIPHSGERNGGLEKKSLMVTTSPRGTASLQIGSVPSDTLPTWAVSFSSSKNIDKVTFLELLSLNQRQRECTQLLVAMRSISSFPQISLLYHAGLLGAFYQVMLDFSLS